MPYPFAKDTPRQLVKDVWSRPPEPANRESETKQTGYSSASSDDSSSSTEQPAKERREDEFGDLLFENILSEIRGMNVLSSYQIHYVKSLAPDKLLKIIELYNVIMCNVNEIL